jgi:putative phosphoesterase
MKIAALYDIHGNLPALDAVLSELQELRPDIIVLGGDIVLGPLPTQTLAHLHSFTAIPIVALRGNCDREVATILDNPSAAAALPEEVHATTRWTAQQLSPDQRAYLRDLPPTLTFSVEELGDILFCHATPSSDTDLFTTRTPQARLDSLFHNVQHPLVVCGHTHMQFELRTGTTRILNAGSVGMPYADQPAAYWLLLGPEGAEFRKTLYDLQAAAQVVRGSGYPQAQDFADENILKIPTAEEALNAFEPL